MGADPTALRGAVRRVTAPVATGREWLVGALARRPLAVAVALLATLGTVRVIEVGWLRLWRDPGTLVLSTLGVVIVGGGLATAVAGVGSVSVDRRTVGRAVLVGVLAVGAVQVAARVLQVAWLGRLGPRAQLVVVAENPILEVAEPRLVVAYLAFGTLGTAVGEELLFRRVLLGPLAARYGFWRGNALQAVLFGGWHLAWPLVYLVAPAESYPSVAVYAVGFVATTATVGLLLGWLVRTTGTVWTAVGAHLIHNVAGVVLHVRSATGDVRGGAVAAGTLVGYLLVALWAHRRYG